MELASEEGLPLTELAELMLGRSDGMALAATAARLQADGIRFYRKKDRWHPRDAAAVAGLQQQQAQRERREAERASLFERLRASVERQEPFQATGDETERRHLEALEALAVWADETPETQRRVAREALMASGVRHSRDYEGAFRLLLALGHWSSEDENLLLRRLELQPGFSEPLLQAARRCSAEPASEGPRQDLTDQLAISIDSPGTTEIDDALSAAPREGGGTRLGIHIADPSRWIVVGDDLDAEAARRGVTHYFPDGKVLMLPPSISEEVASLRVDGRRPAISFLVDLNVDGGVDRFEITRSWIRNARRWSYDEVDAALAEGTAPQHLRYLAEAGQRRLHHRLDRGAIHLGGPEVELQVTAAERPKVVRRDRDAPSQVLVSEAMVLVGEVAARWFTESGHPAIFRWQPEPTATVDGSPGPDPVAAFELRRKLRRAEVSLKAKPHYSLGVEAYMQVTSPLRRYQDLVLQRQLVAGLNGDEPPYDREALQAVAAQTDRAERRARRAEREADGYWMHRWCEQHLGETLQATVLTHEPKPLILLEPLLWERPLSAAAAVEPGQPITVRIERANARAGLLDLSAV